MKTNRSNKLFDQTRIATLGLQDLLAFGQLQPDGTYKVRNVTNSNFLNAIVISEQITYAEILTLATASELVAGKNYTITNAVSGTLSLYIFAVSTSKLAEYGYDTTTGQVYSYDLATDTATNADNTGYINFTPQTAPAYQRGRVWYDSTTETLSVYDDISGTSVQLGQEEILRARNSTGSTILNGAVVYVSGAQGQNPRVSLALANAESTSRVIGVATHNISNNSVGKITTFGIVGDLNTSAYNEGDVLYLSASVAGGLTTTRPSAPNQAVMVGTVIHAAVNDGKILVHTDNYGIGFGTANQVRGMNAAGTAEEYKTIQGTASEVEVLHTANTVTIGLPNAVTISGAMTAGSFVKSGGVSAQFLKADGTVDANAYFYTNAQVTGQALTGLSVSGSAVVSTDSILTGIGKLQNQINAVLGSVNFQGVWNASTNTPTLTSSVGTKGYYYIVTVAGSTNLNGITDWKLGDWAIYDGSAWQKVDNTDAVVSVNGYTGIVTLAAADVGALPTSAISGTTGKLPKFTASGTIGDSIVSESGSLITVSGYVLSTNFTSTTVSDTIDVGTVANNPEYNFIGKSGFWGIRTNTSYEFNIDVYNSGTPKNTLKIKQNGNIITNSATDTGEHFIIGGSARVNGNTTIIGSSIWNPADNALETLRIYRGNTAPFLAQSTFIDTSGGNTNIRNNSTDSARTINLSFSIDGTSNYTTKLSLSNTELITFGATDTGEAHIFGGSARVNGALTVSTGRTGLFSGDNFSLGLAQTVGQANYFYLGTNSSGDLLMSDTNGVAKLTITQAGAATFSSSVTATSFEGTDNLNLTAENTNTNGTVVTINSKGTVGTISLQTNSIDRLTIASTGAATFSSSVQATANASGRSAFFGGASYGIRIDNSGSFNNGGSIIHGVDNTFVASYQKLSLNGSSLEFMTDYTTHLTISNTGQVSVGTPINGRLGVRGTTNNSSAYALEAANASGSTLFIVRNDGVTSVDGKFLIGTFTPGASKLSVVGLPTSASGLSTGDVWNDSGTLKIV